eukprot:scaffold32045_cov29-Tisochrysis_lutea.AAC.1
MVRWHAPLPRDLILNLPSAPTGSAGGLGNYLIVRPRGRGGSRLSAPAIWLFFVCRRSFAVSACCTGCHLPTYRKQE